MTVHATNTTPTRSFGGTLAAAARRFFHALSEASEAARGAREAERLYALSDAQLAHLGIRREQIALHAFRGRASL